MELLRDRVADTSTRAGYDCYAACHLLVHFTFSIFLRFILLGRRHAWQRLILVAGPASLGDHRRYLAERRIAGAFAEFANRFDPLIGSAASTKKPRIRKLAFPAANAVVLR